MKRGDRLGFYGGYTKMKVEILIFPLFEIKLNDIECVILKTLYRILNFYNRNVLWHSFCERCVCFLGYNYE